MQEKHLRFAAIIERLGKPAFQNDFCALYNAECLSNLKKIPSNCIDLSVTSPPYNIGKEYEKNLPIDDYVEWCANWIKELYRISSSDGSFWLNVGYIPVEGIAKALPIPYLLWNKIPFFIIQEIIWNYSAGVAGKKFLSPRNEKILWCVKDKDNYTFNLDDIRDPDVKYPNQKKNGKLKVNPLGKNPSDVWQIPKVTSGQNRSSKERTPHPAQFPEALIERIIIASTNKGDIVLDPFMGSGTTARVAQRLERFVIGFEIKKEYFEISKERQMQIMETKEMNLFDLK